MRSCGEEKVGSERKERILRGYLTWSAVVGGGQNVIITKKAKAILVKKEGRNPSQIKGISHTLAVTTFKLYLNI